LEGEVFALTAKINADQLELLCFDVLTILESASSVPQRIKLAAVRPINLPDSNHLITEPPSKKARTTPASKGTASYHHTLDEVKYAMNLFDCMIRQ
jgi:hypothetical protein